MRNINAYSENCFEFHLNQVKRKQFKANDPAYKSRLDTLSPRIDLSYQEYTRLISEGSFELIPKSDFSSQEKKDLLSLYRYDTKPIQDLHILLTTINNRKFNTCQMCSIDPIGSFDHIVPKEEFPEFSVNPFNLFPCCLSCNQTKGKRWLEKDRRLFYNLYYDTLPDIEFLKINFNSYPIPEFSIDKTAIPSEFYRLTLSHYTKLNLFQRFKESSHEVIDSLVSSANAIIPMIGIEEYRKTVKKSSDEMRALYGHNHWKSLLQVAIVNHEGFENLLVT
ncbi:HNH endonuclease [Brumimicrobium mesophilum]|uniref:HNH endonuclease n=1 Tax=Brumimicrobium mesophilum TaxID=392717 RepID=UPI000D143BB5|nr:HNH endonuclease [Brumimicrobium mesophilum]